MSAAVRRWLPVLLAGVMSLGLLLPGAAAADGGDASDPVCANNPAACTVGTSRCKSNAMSKSSAPRRISALTESSPWRETTDRLRNMNSGMVRPPIAKRRHGRLTVTVALPLHARPGGRLRQWPREKAVGNG